MARIVSAMRIRLARLRVRLYVDFVKSEANLADDPSREHFDDLHALGAVEVLYSIPPPIRGVGGTVKEHQTEI